MRTIVFMLLLCASASAQSDSKPREAPGPLFRPFAINAGISDKYSFTKAKVTITPQATLDYRFWHNRLRAGVTYSYGLETKDKAVTGSLNVKLFEWGRAR